MKDACYYEAKRRYRIFPSAYASGFISRCRKRKGIIRKTKAGRDLRRWYKEVWKDEKGNPCGMKYRKSRTKKCRPSYVISKKRTPITWGEISDSSKRALLREKRRVGMGERTRSLKIRRRIRTKKKLPSKTRKKSVLKSMSKGVFRRLRL